MTFIKANLDVLICGLVALLALGFCFWPVAKWDKDTTDLMQARYEQVKLANRLILPDVVIIPGGPKLPPSTAEQNIIDAKTAALNKVNTYAERVVELAANYNRARRIVSEKVQEKGGTTEQEVPLLGGKPLPNYLPKIVPPAFSFGFKRSYADLFPVWTAKITGGTGPATPPTQQDVQALITQANADRVNAQQAVSAVAGGGAAAVNQLTPREQDEIKKTAAYERASKIHCYMDDHALQMRDWGTEVAPTESQIFEAVVDSWLLQDVVNAIGDLNEGELNKQKPEDMNVGHSPIKRLQRVVIGNGAMAGGGSAGGLFFGVAPAAGGTTPVVNTDASRTVTGHVSNDAYDVVLMRITLDMDPAFENQFIESLYKQNNGYTVLNISTRAVDPLEAAGNGFMYGPTQAVRLDILVEELMFRSWTVPLMPDEIRKTLNLPLAGAAAPGGMGLSR